MYHSITIGDIGTLPGGEGLGIIGKNTWEDWHLIPASRPYVELPEPNANAVEIPYRDGALDITEAVTGYVTYKDRSGSWEFYIANDYDYWVTIKQKISNYLHGKKFKVVLEDDPEYYYEGRLSVGGYKPGKTHSTITINYSFRPYKLAIVSTGDDWLWDPFNFETGVIDTAHDLVIDDDTTPVEYQLDGGMNRSYITINATIESGSTLTVTMNGTTVSLENGANILTSLVPDEGINTLYFLGHGTVTVTYRKGSL